MPWTKPNSCVAGLPSSTTAAWSGTARPPSSRPPAPPRRRAFRLLPTSTAPGLDAARVREPRPGDYVVDVPATPTLIATLTAWLRDRDVTLGELHAGRGTLEEVFLRLTSEDRS